MNIKQRFKTTRAAIAYLSFVLGLLLVWQCPVSAQGKAPQLSFKTKYDGERVMLRWAPSDMDLDYTYRLFKLSGQKEVLLGTYKKAALSEIPQRFFKKEADLITALLYPQSLYTSDTQKLEAVSQGANQRGMAFFLAELNPALATAMGLWAEDTAIEKKQTYAYVVRAFKNGRAVLESGAVASTFSIAVVRAPRAEAKRYDWGCALRWTRYDRYTAFNVYRSTREGGEYVKINTTPVGVNAVRRANGTVDAPPYFFSDTAVDTAGQVYYYKVSGIDSFGEESPKSPAAFAVRDASIRPSPRKPVDIKIEEPWMKISWEADTGEDIKGHNIYRASTYNGTYEKVNQDPVAQNFFVDQHVKYKVNYFYCHTAVDKRGKESVMSLPKLAVLRDRTPPAVPLNLTAVARKGAVELAWFQVTDKDLKGYEIYRASSPTAPDWAMLNKGPHAATRYTDTMAEVLDKKPYYYKVLARDNEANRSGFSNIIEIKLPDVTPPPPPAWKGFKSTSKGIVLEWQASSSKDVNAYRLYRGRGNKRALLAELGSDRHAHTDATTRPGQALVYFLTAVDADDNVSQFSSGLEAMQKDTTPVSLKNLTVSYTPDGVMIRINLPEPGGKTDFKSMTIERKSASQKVFRKIAVNLKIDTFLDRYVDKNKSYTYRITAYDWSGNPSISPETKVTTK